jgi:exonuclease SbcC
MLHISVYDQRGRGEIELLTAEVFKAHPKYTLLYHGVVDGVKFGTHVENETRMSRKSLLNCHRAILGDIHEHMSATPKAVYCGSLIQQNRGESRNKGVVVWNLQRNDYIFKRLHNPAGFLTIDIRPLGDPISDNYRARLVAMLEALKAARDPDFEQVYATTVITNTYSKDGLWLPEVTEIVGGVDTIKRVDDSNTPVNNTIAVANTNVTVSDLSTNGLSTNGLSTNGVIEAPQQYETNMDKSNHRVILEDLLLFKPDSTTAKGKLTREMFEYVWDIHASCEIAHKHTIWTIYKLRFSGLFRYNTGNVIDFKNLHGVCGVIANNRMGKSSILDVIVLALYNTTLRANRGDAINTHSNNAFVTIKFVVNGVMWKLKKEFDRNRQVVKLWERKMEPNGVFKWADATGVDVNETYEKVHLLIGGLREFLATSMQVQESYADDLIRMKNTDRKKTLSRLLGLDQLKDIAEKARSKLNELTKEVGSVAADMPAEVSVGQINALTDEINELELKVRSNEQKLDECTRQNKEASVRLAAFNQIKELSVKIAKFTNTSVTLNNELTNLETNATTLAANCAKYAIELTNSGDYKVSEGGMIKNIVAKIDEHVAKFNQLAMSTSPQMSPLELAQRCALVVKSQSLPHVLPTRDAGVVEAELNSLVAQRTTTSTNVELTDTIGSCTRQIGVLNAKIKSEEAKKRRLIDTAAITDRINAMNSVYKFNPDCKECTGNRGEYHARINLAQVTNELETAKLSNMESESYNATIDKNIANYEAEIAKLSAEITRTNEQLGIRARISERGLELVFAREFHNLSPTQAVAVFKAKSLLGEITTGYNKLNYYITSRKEAVRLEILQCSNYIRMYTEDLKMLTNGHDSNNIGDIENAIKHAHDMEKRCVVMRGELVNMMCDLESKKKLKEKYLNDIVKREKLTTQLAPLNERIVAINEYIKSLDVKSGLPCRLIQESVKALTIKVNELLSEISDFSVNARVEDDKIDFYIRERLTSTSKSEVVKKHGLSVELASGFQKFVIMLAYRLSLAATLPSSADFVFIDEGFGSLDSTNAARIGELLHAVKRNYRFMFIISHIDILHMALEKPITIANDAVNCRSKITYGEFEETIEEDYIIGETMPVVADVNAPAVNVVANDIPVVAVVGANVVANDIADANGNIRCECGRMVKRGNIQRHRQTPTHVAQLAVRQAKK